MSFYRNCLTARTQPLYLYSFFLLLSPFFDQFL